LRAQPFGVTRGGAFYYARGPVSSSVKSRIFTASFDFSTGRFLSAPTDISQDFTESSSAPAWLPDGKRLSYSVKRGPVRNPELLLAIRSVETGEVREIYPGLAYFDDGRWSLDGRSFLTQGQDLKGRRGIFQIYAGSGEATPLVLDEEGVNLLYPVWALDGKSFFFPRVYLATQDRALIQRNLETGNERVLARGRYLQGVNVSPDGRYMVAGNGDPATNSRILSLIPLAGGEIRELMRIPSEVPLDKFGSADGVLFPIRRGRPIAVRSWSGRNVSRRQQANCGRSSLTAGRRGGSMRRRSRWRAIFRLW
jgi:Tol biopolymer transport system component